MITNNGKAFAEAIVTNYSPNISGTKYFYKIERKRDLVSIDGSSVSTDTHNATSYSYDVSDSARLGYGTACVTNLIFSGPAVSITKYPINSSSVSNSSTLIHYSFGYQSEDVGEETYSVDRSYTDTYSEGLSVNRTYGNIIFSVTNLTAEQKTINTFGIYAFIDHTFVNSSTLPTTAEKKYFLLYAEKFDDVTIKPGETYQFTLKRNLE